jgi:hypothetical protein
MSRIQSDILTFLADDLEHTAEWRRQKAEEYPNDDRNIQAAEIMERLAEEIRSRSGLDNHAAFVRRCAVSLMIDGDSQWREVTAYLGRLGFDYFPETANDLIDDLIPIFDRGRNVALLAQVAPTTTVQ